MEVWKSSVVIEHINFRGDKKKERNKPDGDFVVLARVLREKGIQGMWTGLPARMPEELQENPTYQSAIPARVPGSFRKIAHIGARARDMTLQACEKAQGYQHAEARVSGRLVRTFINLLGTLINQNN